MKLRSTLLIVVCIMAVNFTIAQVAGSSIFLQGNYVEVGINECGVYGSDEDPPTGPFGDYHGINFNGLGYIADHEKDGWDVSTEPGQPVFCGDYFTPGSPEEGWAIQIGDSVFENHATYCSGYAGFWIDSVPDIPGANVSYTDSAGVKTAVWEGYLTWDSINLFVRQTTILPDTSLFFISEMEIINEGTEDLTDVYYIRNVDPDQDLDNCGTFMTHNTIESNTPDSDTSFVSAVGGACGCYFGTIAVDPRARVSYGAFFLSPNKPSEAYNGEGPYSIDGDLSCDCAVQITYKFDLAAGESTTLSYARLFEAGEVEEAIEVLEENSAPVILADGEAYSEEDALLICEGQSVNLTIEGFDGYEWIWEPADFLDVASGASVSSTPADDITYTATGTSGGSTISATLNIAVSHTMELTTESSPTLDGGSTGSVSVEVTEGGIEPFTYLWSTGDDTQVVDGLAAGAYTVIVTDAAGCSESKTVNVSVANNLSDIPAEKVFSMYPNPAEGFVILNLMNVAGLDNQVQVTTMNGSLVWQANNQIYPQVIIPTDTWPEGMYLVRISNENGHFVQQLSIAR